MVLLVAFGFCLLCFMAGGDHSFWWGMACIGWLIVAEILLRKVPS